MLCLAFYLRPAETIDFIYFRFWKRPFLAGTVDQELYHTHL